MRIFRLVALWGVHLSLLLVAAGALLTWATGESGFVSLKPGASADRFVTSDMSVARLPEVLVLDTCRIETYPGGEIPRDYVSRIVAGNDTIILSMNRVADVDGYRLTQSRFTADGSVELSVSHDPAGRPVTYAGFALFALSFAVLIFISRRAGRFVAVAFVALAGTVVRAESVKGISEAQADSLEAVQVVYNGRVVTFDTFARDLMTQLSGSQSYRGMGAVRAVGSMILFPDEWASQPVLKVNGDSLQKLLGGDRVSLRGLFDGQGRLRLTGMYNGADARTRGFITELDGRVGLLLRLYSGSLVSAPDPSVARLSVARVNGELVYNRMPLMALACILFVVAAVAGFTGYWRKWIVWCAVAVAAVDYVMRWWIAGNVPLGSMPDTMRLMALFTGLVAAVVHHREPLLSVVAAMACAAVGGVSIIMGKSPATATLMPVLRSPWLGVHVTVVMLSYSLLLVTFLASLCALFRSRASVSLMRFERRILPVAVWLLGLGIATGSVWAELSWGRYWAWDPKETWALVTFAVYSIGLHPKIAALRSPRRWHIYMLVAFAAVIMTYVGVNFLSSLHAYA